MDNSCNNMRTLEQNWQFNSNLIIQNQQFSNSNNPNLKSVPFYSPSDPRFKQSTSYDTFSIGNASNESSKKTDDELWIETYLTKIGKINLNNERKVSRKQVINKSNKKTLKVHVAVDILRQCTSLLKNLQKLESYLRENVSTIPSNEWKEKTIEIGQQKEEFTNLLLQFDSTTLESLKKSLNQRKKKRLLLKLKKKSLKADYERSLKRREIINKNIDDWLEKMKTDIEKAKQEELLKKDADCILSEVTKKKSDARKQLALLSALVKLRNVRQKTAEVNGQKLNYDDMEAFDKNTGNKYLIYKFRLD